jgi:hypothetical protein
MVVKRTVVPFTLVLVDLDSSCRSNNAQIKENRSKNPFPNKESISCTDKETGKQIKENRSKKPFPNCGQFL